jgi:hypothetical protein
MDAAMVIKKTVDTIAGGDLVEIGRAAIASGQVVEFASYQLREGEKLHTEWIDVAFFESDGRAGVSWGAPADWFDAGSMDEAVQVWIAAQNGDEDAIARIEAN